MKTPDEEILRLNNAISLHLHDSDWLLRVIWTTPLTDKGRMEVERLLYTEMASLTVELPPDLETFVEWTDRDRVRAGVRRRA